MNLIDYGIENKLIELVNEKNQIKYILQNKIYKYSDPEEKVRAEYYIELVKNYQYDPKKIDFEITVPRRTPEDSADIVIFEDLDHKKPYCVIECKKDGISDAEFEQAIEQAFGNSNSLRCNFASTIAGNTRRHFDIKNFASRERKKNIIADIPVNFGKIQKFKFKKNDANWDIEPVDKKGLIRLLGKCHNTLWDSGKIDPIDAFDELSKIIFIKLKDEQNPRKKGDPYDFQIKTHENVSEVYKRVSGLYKKAMSQNPEVFSDNLKSSPEKIFTIVNHLQGISLSGTDLDTKGVAFEKFMEDFFRGKQGQYFTPREVVNFIINLVKIDNNSKILDPACGSGGFLLYSLDKVRSQADEYYDKGTAEHFKYWHDFASKSLYGIENSERLARVAKMNMIIHDDGHTNVIGEDALVKMSKIKEHNSFFGDSKFDLILTNPPFGGKVEKKEKAYIKNFILGKTKNGKVRDSQKTEILFIERCYEFLKEGTGILALIIPDGILTNKNLSYVREFMLEKFEITGIFSLPQVTFKHYGAGLKSSILIMRKRLNNEKIKDNKVFCAIINKVGYDGTGRKDESELDSVIKKFEKFKNGSNFYEDNIFVKNINELNNNRLDSYYYSPIFEKIIKDIKSLKHPCLKLGEICEKVKIGKKENVGIFNGTTPAKDDYSESQNDPKIVKVASLKKSKVNLNLVEYVKPDIVSQKNIKDKDILILSSAHQAEYLGRNPCIVNIPEELANEDITFVGELINVRVNKEIVNPYYLLQLFNTKNYYLLINREKRGQTSHLYPSDMKEILIPVPEDISIQNKNADKYIAEFKKYESLVSEAEKIIEDNLINFEKDFFNS